MSDDAGDSAGAQRETPDESGMGAASTTVTPDCDVGRFVAAFVWAMRYGVYLAVAGSLLLVGLVFAFNVRVPRSLQIIDPTVGLLAVITGCWVGG